MRVYRETERTAAELAELKAERERFSRERPGHDDLIASGDYDGPYRQADVMALLLALATLKQERERLGLSLAQVSERSGLDKGMLSRLENGKVLNPTVLTLGRYARAVEGEVRFHVHFPAVEAGPESERVKPITPDQRAPGLAHSNASDAPE